MGYVVEDYIAQAEEAEGMANKVKDEEAKASWLRIAAGYRELAMITQARRLDRDWSL